MKRNRDRNENRLIEIKVRFWTNVHGAGKKISPKHAFSAGVVQMSRNDLHGVEPTEPLPFNSLLELSGKIEKLLVRHGITVHPCKIMSRYILGVVR